VVQETRRWDDNKESSHAMRSKEDAQDYRYFPDPDLVPVWIADEWIDRVKANQPEMRTEKMARYQEEYALPEYDADILTGSKHLADIFEQTVAVCGQPKQVSNWLMTDAMKLLKENEQDPEDMHFSPEHLAKLIELIDKNVINRTVAHTVFEAVFKDDVDPEEYVESHGLKVVNDEGEVKAKIEEIIAANPQSVADFKAGKQKAMGFIVGQTMRAMKGKADPAVVNALVKELLSR
jgi:aspartyl-tRNA(Asn)/glutamyl-tRNA(Gln) amidotransferase subunit B